MRNPGFKLCLAAAVVAVLLGLTVSMEQAQARGGFGGGSFRGNGGVVLGPDGGAVAVGPGGGVAVRGPGGGYVAALPGGATRVLVSGQSYYVADGVYYQPCYVGVDVNYCVVGAPADDGDDDGDDNGDDGDDDGDDD